jgi:hypothetical protein
MKTEEKIQRLAEAIIDIQRSIELEQSVQLHPDLQVLVEQMAKGIL